MHTCVPDGEALFHNVVHEMHPQGHLLVIVTWSKGEGHLAVSGVHHVFVPLGEVVGNTFKQGVNLRSYGQLRDDNSDRVRVFWQFPSARELHHLLEDIWRIQWLGIIKALDQRFNLVEVRLFPKEISLCEIYWEGKLRRPQEVQDVTEKRSITIDEIIPLGVASRGEISPEHGAQHWVWIALQGR